MNTKNYCFPNLIMSGTVQMKSYVHTSLNASRVIWRHCFLHKQPYTIYDHMQNVLPLVLLQVAREENYSKIYGMVLRNSKKKNIFKRLLKLMCWSELFEMIWILFYFFKTPSKYLRTEIQWSPQRNEWWLFYSSLHYYTTQKRKLYFRTLNGTSQKALLQELSWIFLLENM